MMLTMKVMMTKAASVKDEDLVMTMNLIYDDAADDCDEEDDSNGGVNDNNDRGGR